MVLLEVDKESRQEVIFFQPNFKKKYVKMHRWGVILPVFYIFFYFLFNEDFVFFIMTLIFVIGIPVVY
jgi:hypothetical protein